MNFWKSYFIRSFKNAYLFLIYFRINYDHRIQLEQQLFLNKQNQALLSEELAIMIRCFKEEQIQSKAQHTTAKGIVIGPKT